MQTQSLRRLLTASVALGVVGASMVVQAGDMTADGQDAFDENCSVCHSVIAGKVKVGPPLAGVVGRPAAGGPGSRSRPSCIVRIRSQRAAIDSSCVLIRNAVPSSLDSSRSRRSTSSEFSRSRLPVGSSASTSSGFMISARATATRCFWPPDSLEARNSIRSASPTRASSARARACQPASTRTCAPYTGISTFSSAVKSSSRW